MSGVEVAIKAGRSTLEGRSERKVYQNLVAWLGLADHLPSWPTKGVGSVLAIYHNSVSKTGGALFVLLALSLSTSLATTTTFTGAGNWNETGLWSGATIPQDGDVVIVDGTLTLTNTTAILSSYTLNNGRTHTFDGTNSILQATNVTINGTITHNVNMDTGAPWIPDNRVHIRTYNDLTISSSGKIDVTGRGYRAPLAADGYGTGGGIYVDGNTALGAGYGGRGGYLKPEYDQWPGAGTYGSVAAPTDPGSGGANTSTNWGGGSVILEVGGVTTVDGAIEADGYFQNVNHGAGGSSGGGVYITCGSFAGSGLISAKGGSIVNRNHQSGAGGGRVAIIYTNTPAQAEDVSVRYTLEGGNGASASLNPEEGEMGTVYVSGPKFLPNTTMSGTFQLIVAGTSSWSTNSLTITNGCVRFQDGFEITVSGDVTLDDSGGLELRNQAILRVGGNLIITNGAVLCVRAGITNGATDYGALVAVTGDVSIGSGCTIYAYSEPTNGASPLFTMTNFTLASGATFNADRGGYRMGDDEDGYGPGGGKQAANYGTGGGHGGYGGDPAAGGGGVHDSLTAPMDPGSGGGSPAGIGVGGKGGGVVRIQAPGKATIDGIIRANGGAAFSHASGGGAGGAVYVDCGIIAGAGSIWVNGGNGSSGGAGGGGGGGRIALTYSSAEPGTDIGFSANGGRGNTVWERSLRHGQAGTLYLPDNSFFPAESMIGGGRFTIPSLTSWTANNMTLTNGRLQFPDGFQITISNNATIANGGELDLRNGSVISCGGNMLITNNAAVYLFSGPTNGTPDYGVRLHVDGALTVATNCSIYPASSTTNGGSPIIEARNLTVDAGGEINADWLGYQANGSGSSGSGPGGGGTAQGGNYGAGGGYGGAGGSSTNGAITAPGGSTNGSLERPISPGSGGGNDLGDGGGLIRIVATQYVGIVTINGLLTANGEDGLTHGDGGGSGGGIYIDCAVFQGNGELTAQAGDATPAGGGKAGGGGGRIAIWSIENLWSGTALQTNTSVSGGAGDGGYGEDGEDGTIYLGVNPGPPPGTVFLIR